MTLHWHHIIPRHAGGTDDPSNLVQLTVEEHAIATRADVKEKIRAAWTPEKKEARSKYLRSVLKEHKKSTTENMKIPKPLLTCPYCGKIGGGHSNMYRWHFDNCKQREE